MKKPNGLEKNNCNNNVHLLVQIRAAIGLENMMSGRLGPNCDEPTNSRIRLSLVAARVLLTKFIAGFVLTKRAPQACITRIRI